MRDQGGLCVYCRSPLRSMSNHIDHIMPVIRGGTDARGNLQLLCSGCNLKKSDQTDAEFRHRYPGLLPQTTGVLSRRRIRQSEFNPTQRAESYTRFKAGKYLTPAQKVNSGSIATGVASAALVFIPINSVASIEDASALLLSSLFLGLLAAAGVRLRARFTGKDQE